MSNNEQGTLDPLNFIKAEEYFDDARKGLHWVGPTRVVDIDRVAPTTAKHPDHWHAVNITLESPSTAPGVPPTKNIVVIQFIRPTVFRVRFDPFVSKANDYEDFSSRTVIGKTTSGLVKSLDEFAHVGWSVNLDELGDHYVFSSTVTEGGTNKRGKHYYKRGDGLRINIFKHPFRIQAVRTLTQHPDLYPIPGAQALSADRIIWETSPHTFRYNLRQGHENVVKNVILDIIKHGHSEYIGFGEQGGMAFMKKPTYMNYFNFDNMQYQQVYAHGALDSREPLYHSDPFFMAVNTSPEHANVTATFIDNYSQICMDLGKSNSGYIKIGTRFNAMDVYIISGKDVPEVVRLYTGICGRPKLKPKFVLGHHQACYGYETRDDVETVVDYYRNVGIPLDALHIDVDLQDGFRTFTTSDQRFPDFKGLMTELRNRGVKCSTNITPVISVHDRPQGYSTHQELISNGYALMDNRYTNNQSGDAHDVRYVCYGGGVKYEKDPNDVNGRPDYGDYYNFKDVYNTGQPYHGGVSYGYGNGTIGNYPDLNRREVREWWGKQYTYLMESGLEFVWQDMTTPAIHDSYGDMKALPTRLLVSADAEETSTVAPKVLTAIEQMALFAYNLHKATFHGLEKLPSRAGKRNFIIGRGSFAGAYRFAGLWSGDNASSWDFWRITVSQVLSVGLNGVSISGSDMGGFEPINVNGQEEHYCSPELLIRWYSGSVLLPWYRNHYVGAKKGRKWFQEPYAYPIHFDGHQNDLPGQKWLYHGVQSICKYYVELRYSLIQLLYDAMFENQLEGLPIARSMLLTDTKDMSFFNESQDFLDNQYVTGRDILVAPILNPKNVVADESREVYLPIGSSWFPSNLRPWDDQMTALLPYVPGGSVINYYAPIPSSSDENANYQQYPYILPMFIREGAIIPQVQVRQWVGDVRSGPNHIKFNIYPGKNNEYSTYLDDGVSRDSAPTTVVRHNLKAKKLKKRKEAFNKLPDNEKKGKGKLSDVEDDAKGYYREVSVSQITGPSTSVITTRTVTIEPKHNGYDPTPELGTSYTIILWYPASEKVGDYHVTVAVPKPGPAYTVTQDDKLNMIKVVISETIGTSKTIKISARANQQP